MKLTDWKVQFRVILLDLAEKPKWCPSVHLEKGWAAKIDFWWKCWLENHTFGFEIRTISLCFIDKIANNTAFLEENKLILLSVHLQTNVYIFWGDLMMIFNKSSQCSVTYLKVLIAEPFFFPLSSMTTRVFPRPDFTHLKPLDDASCVAIEKEQIIALIISLKCIWQRNHS